MEEDIRLELFTVAEVRDWLVHNQSVRGLSEELIAKTRAWAIVNNPYAVAELKIISAIFVNGEVAAYTYLLPDEVNDIRVYWNTVLFCSPKFEGRGYAAIVIGQFVELYGNSYFDLDAVQESIQNLKFNGLAVEYVDQYILRRRIITGKGIKEKIAHLMEKGDYFINNKQKLLRAKISSSQYSVQYVQFIDDETYDFIKEHAKNDLFIRSREMLNWMLRFPFMQSSPLLSRTEEKCSFSSTRLLFQFYAVQVRQNSKIVGFYIISHSTDMVYVNYLYFDGSYQDIVLTSIAEHILAFDSPKVFTAHKCVADYLDMFRLYSKFQIIHKSFAYPSSFVYDKSKLIQAGDGDNIT